MIPYCGLDCPVCTDYGSQKLQAMCNMIPDLKNTLEVLRKKQGRQ